MGAAVKWCIDAFRSWLDQVVELESPDGTGRRKFIANRAQERLASCPGLRGVPGWWALLKARQLGFTTYLMLFSAWLCWTYPGISILWVTPMEDTGDQIIAKWRSLLRVLEAIPGSGWMPTGLDSKSETEFSNGSRITWHHIGGSDTVADSVGRAGTFALVVLTELGFPSEARFVWRAIDALAPALKRASAPVIIDSTPGHLPGAGEPYRDLCYDIRDGRLDGEVIFFPWWEHEGYAAPVDDPRALAASLTELERKLLQEHGLTLQQLAWRRREASPRHHESADSARVRFARAYPETETDCWMEDSAECLFDPDLIHSIRRRLSLTERGLSGGEVEQLLPADLRGGGGDLLLRPRWGRSGVEYCRVWRPPEQAPARDRRPRYFLGVDPSDGLVGGDWQTIVVVDRAGDPCLILRARRDKVRFSALVQRVAQWYGAWGAIEAQHGEMVWRCVSMPMSVRELAAIDGATRGELDVLLQACGLLTLEQTGPKRRVMIIDAALGLLEREDWCPDHQVLTEMIDLRRWPPAGKIAARSGAHDDLIMGIGLAGQKRLELMAGASIDAPGGERRQSRGTDRGASTRWGRGARGRSTRYDYMR